MYAHVYSLSTANHFRQDTWESLMAVFLLSRGMLIWKFADPYNQTTHSKQSASQRSALTALKSFLSAKKRRKIKANRKRSSVFQHELPSGSPYRMHKKPPCAHKCFDEEHLNSFIKNKKKDIVAFDMAISLTLWFMSFHSFRYF